MHTHTRTHTHTPADLMHTLPTHPLTSYITHTPANLTHTHTPANIMHTSPPPPLPSRIHTHSHLEARDGVFASLCERVVHPGDDGRSGVSPLQSQLSCCGNLSLSGGGGWGERGGALNAGIVRDEC